MIIDGFTFFNEFDMLEFRLKLLYEKVDRFVLVEGDKTFSGNDKPFLFEQHKARFAWAKDKIIHHKAYLALDGLSLDEKPKAYDPGSAFFRIESQQRNAIAKACEPFDDHDILMISDVDEIPSYEALVSIPLMRQYMPVACDQRLCYYNLRHMITKSWRGTIAAPMEIVRKTSPQLLRDHRNEYPFLNQGGWHLSYFGDPDFIANKIRNFAHQEHNTPEFNNTTRIQQYIDEGKDLFGLDDFLPPSRDRFPPYFLNLVMENEAFFFGKMGADF